MHKRQITLMTVSALAFGVFMTSEATASPKVDRTVRNIEMTLNNCSIDQYWDGNAIKPGVPAEATNGWLQSCQANLNRAIGYYNSLGMMERMSPTVLAKDIKGRLDSYQKFAKAAQGNQQVAAASAQASQNVCMQFGNMINDPKTKRVENLLQRQQDETMYIMPENFPKAKEAAVEVSRICKENPALAQLGNRSCPMFRSQYSGADWCAAAEKNQELLGKLLQTYARQILADKGLGGGPDKLVSNEGFLRVNDKFEYKNLSSVSDAEKQQLTKELAKPIEAIGDPSQMNGVYEAIAKSREVMKKKVDELAPTWSVKGVTSNKHYAQGLANNVIKKWHPNAKVIKNFMDNGGYHIDRNALGVPVARRIYGGIVYQVPGEPWCQFRFYGAREEYKGNGAYAKTSGLTIDEIRFQSCNK